MERCSLLGGLKDIKMANNLERFLGGSLGSVLVRLLFLSLLVGAAMAFLGISPEGLVRGVATFVQNIVESGFAAIGDIGFWLLTGAIIVVPIFLILRLLKIRG